MNIHNSRFISNLYAHLNPYVPGEQPLNVRYLKLNTNESPFPPSPGVLAAVERESLRLNLYSDPDARSLRRRMAEYYHVTPNQVLLTNGSDEALNFAFMAFVSEKKPLVFPEITYGFYSVIAKLNHLPYSETPMREDLSIDLDYYIGGNPKTIVIANPNAPTGILIPCRVIEEIVKNNPKGVVIVDEAYIDFGGKYESAVPLIEQYGNLLVVGTFSKSRSMAGARLGFAIGNPWLIRVLNTIRNSVNPYNVNRMTLAAGVAALEDDYYFRTNCEEIIKTRDWTALQLKRLGFQLVPSLANFLFVRHPAISGEQLYRQLKDQKKILIRHFNKERIADYNRITVGTQEQMETLVAAVETILKEQGGLK